MPSSFFLKAGLAILVLLQVFATASTRAASILDRTFAVNGIKTLDFGVDQPIGSCPSPAGKLLVLSHNGDDAVIATRLLESGQLDPGFGTGGMLSLDIQASPSSAVALCRPDGSMWVATRARVGMQDFNVRLFAVNAQGQLISGFGGSASGVFDIDLNAYLPSLNNVEVPEAMSVMPDGSVLLVGSASVISSVSRPFVVKMQANGVVSNAAFPLPAGFTSDITATAVSVGPGGGIWVVGDGLSNGRRPYRMYLDPVTFAVAGTDVGSMVNVRTARGSQLSAGVLVVSATEQLNSSTSLYNEPRVLVFRPGGAMNMITLPVPPISSGFHGFTGISSTVNVSQNKVLFASAPGLTDSDGWSSARAFYFARITLGATAAADRVDDSFSAAGYDLISLRPADCTTRTPAQFPRHLAIWNDRPVVVGGSRSGCGFGSTEDVTVMRFKPTDYIFRDGFGSIPAAIE